MLYVHELERAAVVHVDVDVDTVMRAGGRVLRWDARGRGWEFADGVGILPGFVVVRVSTGAKAFRHLLYILICTPRVKVISC